MRVSLILATFVLAPALSGCLTAKVLGEPDYRFGDTLDAHGSERATGLHEFTVPEGISELQLRVSYRFDEGRTMFWGLKGGGHNKVGPSSSGDSTSETWYGSPRSWWASERPEPGVWEFGMSTTGKGRYDAAIYLCTAQDARPACTD